MARIISSDRLFESATRNCRCVSAGTADHPVSIVGRLGCGARLATAAHLALFASAIWSAACSLEPEGRGLCWRQVGRMCVYVGQLGNYVRADTEPSGDGHNRSAVCLRWRVPDHATETLSFRT